MLDDLRHKGGLGRNINTQPWLPTATITNPCDERCGECRHSQTHTLYTYQSNNRIDGMIDTIITKHKGIPNSSPWIQDKSGSFCWSICCIQHIKVTRNRSSCVWYCIGRSKGKVNHHAVLCECTNHLLSFYTYKVDSQHYRYLACFLSLQLTLPGEVFGWLQDDQNDCCDTRQVSLCWRVFRAMFLFTWLNPDPSAHADQSYLVVVKTTSWWQYNADGLTCYSQ